LSKADVIPADSLRNRWNKRIGASMPPEWDPAPKKRPLHQSSDYGRLSPPTFTEKNDQGRIVRGSDQEAVGTPRPRRSSGRLQNGSLGMSPLTKIGLRQEAFDAVSSSVWSDVGLVSVSGHQVEEEEL
jgi:hypothetical protein